MATRDTRFLDDAFRNHPFERNNQVGLPEGVKKIHIPDASQQEVTFDGSEVWLGQNLEFEAGTPTWEEAIGVQGRSHPDLSIPSGVSGVTQPSGVPGLDNRNLQCNLV